MPDIVNAAVRSEMMSNIRAKNTHPELVVRRYLHRQGLRYRLHVATLAGVPDIVLPKYRCVVFVHGCFWHRHPGCKYAYTPKSNVDFWQDKLSANRARDLQNERKLIAQGWTVFTIWECSVGGQANLAALAAAIRS